MNRFVVLMRGVNVGGNGKLPMADLRLSLTRAGFSQVRTVLQSGTVLVDSELDAAGVEALVKEVLLRDFGFRNEVVLVENWDEVLASNPMRQLAEGDPAKFLVHVFRSEVAVPEVKPPALAVPVGRFLFVYHPEGLSASPLFRDRLWQKAIASGTARNWNTVGKIAQLFRS